MINRAQNGNLCIIIEDDDKKKYSIEFENYDPEPCFSNLYGVLGSKFQNKTDNLDHLIKKDNYIEVNVNYLDNPIRIGYRINYVSNKQIEKVRK
mgnify:CR=1 FL=1